MAAEINVNHVVKGRARVGNVPGGEDHMVALPFRHRALMRQVRAGAGLNVFPFNVTKRFCLKGGTRQRLRGIPVAFRQVVVPRFGFMRRGIGPGEGMFACADGVFRPTHFTLLIQPAH